ncbi:soluble lytic murein transglycosylase-like protein [Sphingobium sp. B2D3A]|nr:soluble lytic murein transglycosylase-like protein [Sphingobium sp. B2D3A]
MMMSFSEAAQHPAPEASRPTSVAPFVLAPFWMKGTRASSARQIAMSASSTSCAAPIYRKSALLNAAAEKRREMIYPVVHDIACRSGLPVGLMDALIIQESGYNHSAISKKGAFGLGQLMPDTARQLGVNSFDLRDNLRGAAAYLKQQLDSFGQVHLALAAYNAGPGRVRKKREIPNIEETQIYVRRILANWYHLTGIANERTSRAPIASARAEIVRVY